MGKRNKIIHRELAKEKAVKENEMKVQEAIQNDQCPICFDPFAGNNGPPYQNSLGCSNRHSFCVPCMRELVRPNLLAKKGGGEDAIEFTCPLCRDVNVLKDKHVMVLIKGSWPKFRESMEEAFSHLA